MSEFECSNGHMPAPSTIKCNHCPCGAAIIRVDGMSGRQLREMDEAYENWLERNREREEGGEEE